MRWSVVDDQLIPLPPIEGANGWVQSIAFHPSEKVLFVSDSWGRLACTPCDGDAPVVHWEHGAAHDGSIRKLAVSPDGTRLATCGADRFVRIWNSSDGALVTTHEHAADVFAVTFTPDGTHLVFGDLFGRLFALDSGAGKIVREFDAGLFYKLSRLQDVGGLRTLTFLAGGSTLVAGGCQPENGGFLEGAPLVLGFDFNTGKLVSETRPGGVKDGFIHDLAWHPIGFLVAVTSGQPGAGKLVFLNPGEKEPTYTNGSMANCHAVALHPNGRRIVVTSTNRDSNGNGRLTTKDGQYPTNSSPLHLFEVVG